MKSVDGSDSMVTDEQKVKTAVENITHVISSKKSGSAALAAVVEVEVYLTDDLESPTLSNALFYILNISISFHTHRLKKTFTAESMK